jgi:hypothetical protein
MSVLISPKIASFLLWSNKLHPAVCVMNFISAVFNLIISLCFYAISVGIVVIVVRAVIVILLSVYWATLPPIQWVPGAFFFFFFFFLLLLLLLLLVERRAVIAQSV